MTVYLLFGVLIATWEMLLWSAAWVFGIKWWRSQHCNMAWCTNDSSSVDLISHGYTTKGIILGVQVAFWLSLYLHSCNSSELHILICCICISDTCCMCTKHQWLTMLVTMSCSCHWLSSERTWTCQPHRAMSAQQVWAALAQSTASAIQKCITAHVWI